MRFFVRPRAVNWKNIGDNYSDGLHIAVAHGAGEGLKFIEYVDYLRAKGFIPPNGDKWVDKIRTSGNEATHEIRIMVPAESQMIIGFVEMLLRFVFEFPSLAK